MSRVWYVLWMMLFSTCVWADESLDIAAVKHALIQESKQQGRQVIEDAYQRDRIVHHFVKKLAKLDDLGLGDVQREQNKQDLVKLQHKIEALLHTYQTEVRPVLLNNIKLKRKDSGARMNKVDLSKLVFPTKYNHKTRRPIAGVFHYKQDIDDSLFGEHWVDAGLLVNFPELKNQAWVRDALRMDAELLAFWRIHMAYMDGIAVKKNKITKQSQVHVSASDVNQAVHDLPAHQRERLVRKFVRRLQKLDASQPWSELRQALQTLLASYAKTIQPILVDNVNQRRVDVGARANKGDLIGLFYDKHRKGRVGTPITDVLQHYIAAQPALADDAVVKQALAMEQSLAQLRKEHMAYLQQERSLMW